MKISFLHFLILVLAVTMTSCRKEFPNDPIDIRNLSVSGCKTNGSRSNGIYPEYITIKTVDDYYLLINHINSMLNCEPGEISVSLENISLDKISCDENESSSLANCICPYDIEFKLGPLEYSTYTILFKKGGLTFKELYLSFNKSTDIKIYIQ